MGKKGKVLRSNKTLKGEMVSNTMKKLPLMKRNELNKLVNNLLLVTTDVFSLARIPPAKSWELHLKINEIVSKIIAIEKEIDPPFPPRTPESLEAFKLWMKSNDAEIENVDVCEFSEVGYGLKAQKDVNQGSLVLSVPRNLMLTSDAVKNSPLRFLWESDPLLHNMPNISLSFLLLLHKLDESSYWTPYIKFLPQTYDTVMYFTPDELQQLRGSPVLDKALKQCQSIARQYAYFYNLFQCSNDPASLIFREHFTYNLYRWAVSTVMTRQNAIPGEKGGVTTVHALIPFWDMCNHTNAKMTTDYNVELGTCECYSHKTFKKGEEVTISYGKRPNADLLLHNGFVYPDCLEDEVRIRLGVSPSDPLFQEKKELLDGLGVPVHTDFPIFKGDSPFSDQLISVLRVFVMKKESPEETEEKENGETSKGDEEKNGDTNEEGDGEDKPSPDEKVWDFFLLRLNLLFASYPTTIEEDEKMLEDKSGEMTSRTKLAIQLRICEKKILNNAIDCAQKLKVGTA